jgi:GNAT superfamily N-acetyltransferase
MITVGELDSSDRTAWEALFRGYVAFYQRALPPEEYDRAWRRFRDGDQIHALGARLAGQLVGIAHFLAHPHTNAADVCYLQDLYTDPAARGRGVARALIGAVERWARDRGCGRLYWHTQAGNTTARALYDQVAEHRGFIVYQRDL